MYSLEGDEDVRREDGEQRDGRLDWAGSDLIREKEDETIVTVGLTEFEWEAEEEEERCKDMNGVLVRLIDSRDN